MWGFHDGMGWWLKTPPGESRGLTSLARGQGMCPQKPKTLWVGIRPLPLR